MAKKNTHWRDLPPAPGWTEERAAEVRAFMAAHPASNLAISAPILMWIPLAVVLRLAGVEQDTIRFWILGPAALTIGALICGAMGIAAISSAERLTQLHSAKLAAAVRQ